jgi:aspartate 1-decarboxylase
MNIIMMKSKIHRAAVTGVDVGYEGSIVIDPILMDEVGLRRYEKVLVADLNNGNRFETYVIEGERGAGDIKLNGATAHLGEIGDRLTIFAFAAMPEAEATGFQPRIVQLDKSNSVVRRSFAK